MPPTKVPVGGKKLTPTNTTDNRFSDLLKQPRFKSKQQAKAKEVIDERFKDVMDDEDFQVKSIDKYNRVNKDSNKETMAQLYDTSQVTGTKKATPSPATTKKSIPSPATTKKVTPLPAAVKKVSKAASAPISTASKRRLPPQSRAADSEEEEEQEQEESDLEDIDSKAGADIQAEEAEDSTDIGTSGDDFNEDDEEDGEIVPDGYTQGSIRGSLAPLIEQPTKRLALYNMEWDQLRAVDILAIFRSLCPAGGSIPRVSVFPSEKGKVMLEREKRGDFTLWMDPQMDQLIKKAKDDKLKKKQLSAKSKHFQETAKAKKDGKKLKNTGHIKSDDITLSDSDDYLSDTEIDRMLFNHDEEDQKVLQQNRLRLQEYEMNKLSYFYAIIECDTVNTALKLYNDADGLEYESSGNVFDLRFVPDGHAFDEKTLRDRSTMIPPGHRPPVYQTSVLSKTKFECTWEREDPQRTRLLRQDFTKGDYRVDDLTAFLANESDDEGFNTDVPISETDDSSDDNNDHNDESEQFDEDDESASDDDTNKRTLATKVKSDTLGDDRIVDHKLVDGKKKKVVLLKRRARNDFASILAEINSNHGDDKKSKVKKDKLKQANDENDAMSGISDEDDDEEEEEGDAFTSVPGTNSDSEQNDLEMNDNSGDDSEDELAKRLAEIKRKLATKGNEKKTKIVLSTGVHKSVKETEKSLALDHFRTNRVDQWKQIVDSSKTTTVQKETKTKGPQVLAGKKPVTGVVDSDGEADSDDYLDDDEFFRNAREEYFPEAEFGAVKFNNKAKQMDDSSDDSDAGDDDVEDTRPHKSIQNTKKRQNKGPIDPNDEEFQSSGDEGYNLQELVHKNKIKQVAIQNKKKSAKQIEQDLINQSLGVDSYTTSQNTSLSAKDIKSAAYVVNKQAISKKKKAPINYDDLSAQKEVSLAAGGEVSKDFKVNVHDDRFTSLFDDADFGIDVNNPLYQNTEGATQILAETQKRRQVKQQKQLDETKKRKAGINSDATKPTSKSLVSSDITSLIGKTKAVAKARKQM